MSVFYPVAEVVEGEQSQYVRFFKPTRYEWQAKAKLALFKLWHVGPAQRVVTRIVDADRAQFLLLGYSEWLKRRNVDMVKVDVEAIEGSLT